MCFLLNYTYNSNIDGIPIEKLTGRQADISVLLRFHWNQPVYYKAHCSNKNYPSHSSELRGQIVGIADHVGHYLTYRVLTDNTLHIISTSELRPADPTSANKRADLLSGEELQTPFKFLKRKEQPSIGDPAEITEQNNMSEPSYKCQQMCWSAQWGGIADPIKQKSIQLMPKYQAMLRRIGHFRVQSVSTVLNCTCFSTLLPLY